jgi:S-adenosyl methyltransferase
VHREKAAQMPPETLPPPTRPGCMTPCWAARTTTPRTGQSPPGWPRYLAGEAAICQFLDNSLPPTSQTSRTREQVTRLFDGLQLQEAGVVQLNKWRPGSGDASQGT